MCQPVSHSVSPPQTKPLLGFAFSQISGHFQLSLEKDSPIICNYCKEDNHMMSDCFKLKKKCEIDSSLYLHAFSNKQV